MTMGPVIFNVDDKTNIHVAPSKDRTTIQLTTIIDGKPVVTITYSVDELLMFNWLLLHNLSKIM